MACRTAVLVVALVIGLALSWASQPAWASHSEADVEAVLLDADPLGNTSTSVGSTELCVSVPIGYSTSVDVVVPGTGIPLDRPFIGFQFTVSYDEAVVQVTDRDVHWLLAVDPNSSVFDASPGNNSDGGYDVAALDIGIRPDGSLPAETGPGTLARLTFSAVGGGSTFVRLDGIGLVDTLNETIPVDEGNAIEIVAGHPSGCLDADGDGIRDVSDNCPDVPNLGQANFDGDSLGDACDPDVDGDGVDDISDLCPRTLVWFYPNTTDANGCSDRDVDIDLDGACEPNAPSTGPSQCEGVDNCPGYYNASQEDIDGDGLGEPCDTDADGDGASNVDEYVYGSDMHDPNSFPEAMAVDPSTCFDGFDNDHDGLIDRQEDRCPPPNDEFADAKIITQLPFQDSPRLDEATADPGEPTGCGGTAHSVWYRYASPVDRRVMFHTGGSSPDMTLAVYAGESFETLQLIACNDEYEEVAWVELNAGQPVYIQIAPRGSIGGFLHFFADGDADRDGEVDSFDNCPTVSNPSQIDWDGDGLGDACDSTPDHDLTLEYVSASNPVIERGQSASLNLRMKITNRRPHEDFVKFTFHFVYSLPDGCSVTNVKGEPATVAPERTSTVTVHLQISCSVDANPGVYPLELGTSIRPWPEGIDYNWWDNSWYVYRQLTVE